LRATQYSILAALKQLGAVSINDLANRLDSIGRQRQEPAAADPCRPGQDQAVAHRWKKSRRQLTPRGAATVTGGTPALAAGQRAFEKANGETLARTLRRTLSRLRNGPRTGTAQAHAARSRFMSALEAHGPEEHDERQVEMLAGLSNPRPRLRSAPSAESGQSPLPK